MKQSLRTIEATIGLKLNVEDCVQAAHCKLLADYKLCVQKSWALSGELVPQIDVTKDIFKNKETKAYFLDSY